MKKTNLIIGIITLIDIIAFLISLVGTGIDFLLYMKKDIPFEWKWLIIAGITLIVFIIISIISNKLDNKLVGRKVKVKQINNCGLDHFKKDYYIIQAVGVIKGHQIYMLINDKGFQMPVIVSVCTLID
jgi:hypothetical protein